MSKKRKQKKRIKDCLSQMKYVDSIYSAEIQKPEAEQDTDLVEECLETMSYLHDVVASLSQQLQSQGRGAGSKIVLRRVAIVAVALVVLFVGMSVAEAAGFRIWSALIHWDSRYLHITYVPEGQNTLPTDYYDNTSSDGVSISEGSILEEVTCETIDEAMNELGLCLLLPKYIPEGLKESYISYAYVDKATIELIIRWSGMNNHIYLYVSTNLDMDGSSDYLFQSDDLNMESFVYSGITFYRSDDQIHWIADNTAYSIDTNINDSELELLLKSLSY